MKNFKIAILGSGVTLGVYNPALIVHRKLTSAGIASELFVCENLFFNDKKSKISEMRTLFHRDFKFALMGQKISKTVQNNFDPDLVNEVMVRWNKEGIIKFIVFSGFWIDIVHEYTQRYPGIDYRIDICHMDAVVSESWKSSKCNTDFFNHIWFFNWDRKKISLLLKISSKEVIDYKERDRRFVIHGGGWGIGTYRQKIWNLENKGIKLNIVNYEVKDIEKLNPAHNYYLIDPSWNAWETDENGQYQFPPFGLIVQGAEVAYVKNSEYQEVYNLIRSNLGIISKPGGATIIDSLSSATPVIFLEPFGGYERRNAELMVELGLGVWYDEWEKESFSIKLLERCHEKLVAIRSQLPEFTDLYREIVIKNLVKV